MGLTEKSFLERYEEMGVFSEPNTYNAPVRRCNICKHYQDVHMVNGHAPCSFWGIGGVMWNDFCSRFEYMTNPHNKPTLLCGESINKMDNKAIITSITTISEALKTASDELNKLAGMLEERDKNAQTIADYIVDIEKCIAKSIHDNVKEGN